LNDWKFLRERRVLREHEGQVNSVEFSPNGSQFVTASNDTSFYLRNARSGALLFQGYGHDAEALAAH